MRKMRELLATLECLEHSDLSDVNAALYPSAGDTKRLV